MKALIRAPKTEIPASRMRIPVRPMISTVVGVGALLVGACSPPPPDEGCFRHQLLLPRPYLVLTKPLRLDIQCQRAASVKIGWKYLDD